MATLSAISLPMSLSILFLFLSFTPFASTAFPSSSIASDQFNFWSKNVVGSMPEDLASQLSPLSKQDSASLAFSVSKPSVYSGTQFCSMANLACSPLKTALIAKPQIYTGYGGKAQTVAEVGPNSFFRLSSLKNGKNIQTPSSKIEYPARKFLPSQIASKISVTSATDIRKLFPNFLASHFSEETMKTSISICSSQPSKGETRTCATSLEQMLEFSKKTLGAKKLAALTSQITQKSVEEAEIVNIKQFHAEKMVSCHEVFFPFSTYMCHLLSSTRLYAIDLVEPTTKAPVSKMIAVCHMDTSEWPADHVSFKILKSSPGKGEACHWFTKFNIAWIANAEKESLN